MPKEIAPTERVGYAVVECPECKAGEVRTERAAVQLTIPGGVRFLSVPCSNCPRTFTIEVMEKKPEPGT